jgi:hypothetical protein
LGSANGHMVWIGIRDILRVRVYLNEKTKQLCEPLRAHQASVPIGASVL